jgi:predicted Zn-dependent protease
MLPPRSALPIGLALLAAVGLAGCRPAAVRAQQNAALADQLIGLKAYPAAATTLAKATALDPDNPDLWLRLGRVQLQANNPGGADQAFQRASELAPDNVEALENLTVLAVRAGQLDRAKRYMDPLLVLQPDDAAGLLAGGAIALQEHRTADARAAADRLVAGAPEIAEGHILLARSLAAAHQMDEAVAILRKRIAVLKEGPDAIEARALLVSYYRQMGNLAGVRSIALELFRLKPGDPSYALEAARAFHAAGQGAQADRAIAGLLKAHPGAVAIVQAVIQYRRATLPPSAAVTAIETLASGASRPVVVSVANALTDMGAPARAIALVAPLTAGPLDGAHVDATVALARALIAAGRTAEARSRLDAVLAFDPGNVAALVARGGLRLAAGDRAGALTDSQLAWSDDQTNQAAALLVAKVHVRSGEAALAQQAYALAIQAFPDSYPVLATYLDWLGQTGQADNGLQPLASYARRHRGDGVAWQRYALLCRRLNDPCATETRLSGT